MISLYCTHRIELCDDAKFQNGKMEEGGIGRVKVQQTNANGNDNEEKRKWPALCDANPYIVDLLNNLFKKKETSSESSSTN